MNNTSLEIVSEAVIQVVNDLDINELDKVELILNLYNFLEPSQYSENVAILMREKRKKR